MENRHLPAGLLNEYSEIFADDYGFPYELVKSAIVPADSFPTPLYNALESAMLNEPKRHSAIIEMVDNAGRQAEVRQFAHCCYGGFDHRPDFANGILGCVEFWPCSKRGNCRFEGVICTLKTATGHTLTKREIEYASLTAEGYFDKEIAVIMKISEHTVTTHSKNVRAKTGLSRKADLTRFAIENNLLKSGKMFLQRPGTE